MGGGIQHLKECEFLPVLCPLKCVESDGGRRGEVVRVERRQLAQHEREFCSQRELKCEFCGGAVRACEMNPHLGECEEFPVDCPNDCEAAGETGTRLMKRGAVLLHLTECPLQRVECPYKEYGCGEEMERRQLDLHEGEYMHTHFRLAMKEMKRKQIESSDKIKMLEKENTDLKETQISEANNKINCLEKLSAVKDSEIISINKEIKELKTLSIEMKQKQTESNKLKDSQILEANNKINCLEKQITEKNCNNISVQKEINELRAESNEKINRLEKLSGLKDSEIISIHKEINELKEIISTLKSTGGLELKFKGVKQKIKKKEDTHSDPFYVGLYKCQGCIEWDYSNTGKVGCFICIMKGEFDDKLKWPFIHRYKFVLFSQYRNEDNHIWSREITKDDLQKYPECFRKPTEARNRSFGHPSFISNTEIFTEKYCKDDSISLHITVEQLPTF